MKRTVPQTGYHISVPLVSFRSHYYSRLTHRLLTRWERVGTLCPIWHPRISKWGPPATCVSGVLSLGWVSECVLCVREEGTVRDGARKRGGGGGERCQWCSLSQYWINQAGEMTPGAEVPVEDTSKRGGLSGLAWCKWGLAACYLFLWQLHITTTTLSLLQPSVHAQPTVWITTSMEWLPN